MMSLRMTLIASLLTQISFTGAALAHPGHGTGGYSFLHYLMEHALLPGILLFLVFLFVSSKFLRRG